MSEKGTRPGSQRGKPPRMTQPKQHDTYAARSKSADAVVCETCGVVHHAGRWHWGAAPLTDVRVALCPACERIRDNYPAGTIRVPARFLTVREELLNLLENAETSEKQEHPLERLMGVDEDPDGGLVVRTTGIHLARVITSRLERRFHEKARINYGAEQNLVTVDWAS